jgi:intracellular septation protein
VSEADKSPAAPGPFKLLLDFGPLLVWLVANKLLGVFGGVAAFMVAIVVALILSQWKLKRISPMLWLTALLVLGFGGLTLLKRDPYWIQVKPTIIYMLLSGILFAGLLTGRTFIKSVLEYGYTGLSERGWTLLTRNWACFFLSLALVNEVLRRVYPGYAVPGQSPADAQANMSTWLSIKVWGVTALSMAFAAANIPMLMKHGLGDEGTGSGGGSQ